MKIREESRLKALNEDDAKHELAEEEELPQWAVGEKEDDNAMVTNGVAESGQEQNKTEEEHSNGSR